MPARHRSRRVVPNLQFTKGSAGQAIYNLDLHVNNILKQFIFRASW